VTLLPKEAQGNQGNMLNRTDVSPVYVASADCPDELAELRGVLLREHEWRVREGLA